MELQKKNLDTRFLEVYRSEVEIAGAPIATMTVASNDHDDTEITSHINYYFFFPLHIYISTKEHTQIHPCLTRGFETVLAS